MAFTIPEGLFELTVMFFRLINSLVTFQAMMNELLRDLINMGKVAVFIDDVIEMIRKLEENDLYVKPEKYKWKVRKVGFLGVVIGLEGIKIEEEKVKGVLEWLTPKYIKDIQKFLELANYYY